MKPSRYNHFVPVDGKLYAFNCLSEKFFPVPPGREETYRELLNKPELYAEDFAAFYDKMLAGGFILEDDADEMEMVRKKYEMMRRPWEYSLMVMPTYSCNLRCWYCIQDHVNVSLPDEYFDRLKRHFDTVVKRDDIKVVKLWWFGGEPMIKYDKVLDLNLYVKHLCEENGKTFSANITTNSTLLTPERVDRLRESGVDHYQISIDGPKRIHDTVKVLPNRSAFDHALAIVDHIARTTHVTLRFNFTKETLLPDEVFNDIDTRLSADSRKNIRFFIYKVWQEDHLNIDQTLIDRLSNLSLSHNVESMLSTCGLCYADQANFFCVFPNGLIDKCDNLSIDEARGTLNQHGNLTWPEDTIDSKTAFEDNSSICHKCSYLPSCWGPCIAKRNRMIKNTGHITCYYGNDKQIMRTNIDNRIHNFISRSLTHQEKRLS